MTELPRPVEVLHKGKWYPGWLEATYRDSDGRWHCFVRYRIAPGLQYLQWRDRDEVRPVEE